MDMAAFNVQFTIEDRKVSSVLRKKAVDLEDKLPKQARTGGSTLAKAIVEAVIKSNRIEEVLDFLRDESTQPHYKRITPRKGTPRKKSLDDDVEGKTNEG